MLVAERAEFVPVGAADFVERLVGELHDVVGVDAHDRLGSVLADRLGVAGTHVHRDRLQPPGAREHRGLDLQAGLEPRARDAVSGGDGRARAERDHDRRLARRARLLGMLGWVIGGRRVEL